MPSVDAFRGMDDSNRANREIQRSSLTRSCLYSADFFDFVEAAATRSAHTIVPHVLDLFKPTSVVDVGCGRGAWLRVFAEHGVESICGIDGDYVDRNRLLIPEQCFTTTDLSGQFRIPGRFDLAVCLEVAEHLPPASAEHLISQLVTCAPVILFSAAVPGQGGTGHLNEQWPEYWRQLFASHSYRLIDGVRHFVLQDERVDWWYRQNIVMYGSESALIQNPVLQQYLVRAGQPCIEWLHKNMVARNELETISGRVLCRLMIGRVLARMRLGTHRTNSRALQVEK